MISWSFTISLFQAELEHLVPKVPEVLMAGMDPQVPLEEMVQMDALVAQVC